MPKMIRENKKLPDGTKEKIPELIRSIKRDKEVIALYSFGSLAKDALRPMSDLDFGVLLNNKITKKQSIEKHIELIGLFTELFKTEEIDLILMNQSPSHIAFQIIKTGNLLFCGDRRSLVDFIERVIGLYLDFKPLREEFDSTFMEGIGYYG